MATSGDINLAIDIRGGPIGAGAHVVMARCP